MPSRPHHFRIRSPRHSRPGLFAGAGVLAASVLVLSSYAAEVADAGAVPLSDAGSVGAVGSLDPAGSLTGSGIPGGPGGFQPSVPGPEVQTEVLFDGLTIPWDVLHMPDGTIITGERDTGRVIAMDTDGAPSEVSVDFQPAWLDHRDGILDNGDGLLGMTLGADFEQNRELFACVGRGGEIDEIQVVRWKVAPDHSAFTDPEVVVSGIPLADEGGHHGCALETHPVDGSIFVGTGDSYVGTVPQDLNSLGGKTLNINPDGTPGPHSMGEPETGADSIVSTFGHRNVQGLAFRPGTDQLYTSEHGPAWDDEVNLHRVGGNYGWSPERDGAPEHHDDSPMTDLDKFPDAVEAVWSSGAPPLAPSGSAFLDGEQWGEFDGALAVAMLATQQIMLLQLSDDGESVEDSALILVGDHGRLRSLTPDADGNLLVTTSNGDAGDVVFRLTPA